MHSISSVFQQVRELLYHRDLCTKQYIMMRVILAKEIKLKNNYKMIYMVYYLLTIYYFHKNMYLDYLQFKSLLIKCLKTQKNDISMIIADASIEYVICILFSISILTDHQITKYIIYKNICYRSIQVFSCDVNSK